MTGKALRLMTDLRPGTDKVATHVTLKGKLSKATPISVIRMVVRNTPTVDVGVTGPGTAPQHTAKTYALKSPAAASVNSMV